jgi:Fur family ferric uptake transcriptional regulator
MDNSTTSSERQLRAAGKRVTAQRKRVLDVLSKAKGHLDANEIHELARRLDPRLSLATVYRTLHVLKESGLVRELHLDDTHHHYELDSQNRHSHLVCTVCGQVIEVDSASFTEAAQAAGHAYGFEVASAHVELTGVCASCQKQQSTSP